MKELLEAGGPLLWLQFALAFLGLVLVLERLLYFQTVKTRVTDLLLGLDNHIRKQAYAEARHEAARERGPAARVAHSILIRHALPRTNLREVAEEAIRLEVPRMEKNLRILLGVALIAPLTGLLGTAVGLLDIFGEMAETSSTVAQSTLARGIFEALITTVLGLSIASAAYGFYLVLLGKAKRLLSDLERTGIEVVNMVMDARDQAEIVLMQEQLSETVSRRERRSRER
ncbi:MAG: MotA/TolQ/ExbB proton channel family protein [Verrucomicrobiota bacterium JB023]|nr:MotA/TolQ/ExbB proton channel family protein [Verrucomicrobiota bacterium JB023]